jgi:hypothetical protein
MLGNREACALISKVFNIFSASRSSHPSSTQAEHFTRILSPIDRKLIESRSE